MSSFARLSIHFVSRSCRLLLCIGALALPAIALAATESSNSTQQSRDYVIAAGSLESALIRYSSVSGITLSFTPDLVQGKHVPALRGTYTPQQALDLLLRASGLAARQQGNSFTLEKLPDGVLPTVQVSAAMESATQTEGSGSYQTSHVSLGKGQSLRETPQSMTVITRQRIEDQGLNTLGDVLLQTPGLTATTSTYAPVDRIYSRGFQVKSMQIDGVVSGELNGYFTTPNLVMYDSVEVVRGADGLFAGNGDPGGSINLVRKRPLKEPQLAVNGMAGSWENYRGEVDVSSPLAFDGKVRGRAVAAYANRGFFYDVASSENPFFYGIVEADITENTTVSVGGSYDKNKGVIGQGGMPRTPDGRDLKLPRRTALFADWGSDDYSNTEYFTAIEHRISSNWVVKAQGSVSNADRFSYNGMLLGAVDAETGLGGQLNVWGGTDLEANTRTADINITGEFNLFGREHKVLAGADWNHIRFTECQIQVDLAEPVPPQNVYTFDPSAIPRISNFRYSRCWRDYGARQEGYYTRINWSLSDKLSLITGARLADYEYKSPTEFFDPTGKTVIRKTLSQYGENNIFTPYVGLTYELNPQWMFYASLTDIYKAQPQRLAGPPPGTPLDAVEGNNAEVGVKASFFEGRLTGSLAVYRIEQTGEAARDPSYPSTPVGNQGLNCCWFAKGKIVSEGVDVEFNGELLPGWQLSAGYTYNSNENANTNLVFQSLTPRHLFKFWSDWMLSGSLSGWSVGLGATAQSENYVSGQASSWNPQSGQFDGALVPFKYVQGGYAVWNGRVAYQISNNWSAAVNVNNLFDKTWYQTVGQSASGNYYGEPLNAMLTLRGKY